MEAADIEGVLRSEGARGFSHDFYASGFFPFGFFESYELGFGKDKAILCGLRFERLETLFERLQVMPHPDGAYSAGRDKDGFLFEFIRDAKLAKSRLLDCEFEDGFFDVLLDPVLCDRLLATYFLERFFTACVVEVPKPVEAVSGVTHDFARLGDISQLLCQLKQSDLGFDDLLFCVHLTVISCKEDAQAGVRLRQASAGRQPRLLSDICQIKSWLLHFRNL